MGLRPEDAPGSVPLAQPRATPEDEVLRPTLARVRS